jgi:AcrR family transcriptional regulator
MYVYPDVAEERKKRPRAAHQLKPGRNKLSRSDVEANQRQRIMEAIVDVASLAGYSSLSVEEIVGTAGVSRRTFYDHFRSKDEAFLATVDSVSDALVDRVTAAYGAADRFPAAIREGLAAFLGFLADEPRYADLLIVEILAAGPESISRRNRVMGEFAKMVREGAKRERTARQPPELAAETIIGGIYEVVFSRVLQGQTTELPKLLPDLAYALMQPYLGDAVAKREAAKAPKLPNGQRVAAA